MFPMPTADFVRARLREIERQVRWGSLARAVRPAHSSGWVARLLAMVARGQSARSGTAVLESCDRPSQPGASPAISRPVVPSARGCAARYASAAPAPMP